MRLLKNLVNVTCATLSFISVFYAVAKLMLFLSRPSRVTALDEFVVNKLLDDETKLKKIAFSLSVDLILIIIFIFQHSLLKADIVKAFYNKVGLDVAERSIYNIASSWSLLLLIQRWQRETSVTLWNIDVDNSTVLWWTFVMIHTLGWTVIYGGSLLMDFCEIIGAKQAYYYLNQLKSPSHYKSQELQRVLSHIRHPSFTGLVIILWGTNCMSLDRLLIAVMWTLYMYIAWNTEPRDVQYQKNQLTKKRYELSNRNY